MTSEELNAIIAKAVKDLGFKCWEDDVHAVVQLVPDEVLELGVNRVVFSDRIVTNWDDGWVKACEQEIAERIILNNFKG